MCFGGVEGGIQELMPRIFDYTGRQLRDGCGVMDKSGWVDGQVGMGGWTGGWMDG